MMYKTKYTHVFKVYICLPTLLAAAIIYIVGYDDEIMLLSHKLKEVRKYK